MRQLSFKRHRFPADIMRHSVWLDRHRVATPLCDTAEPMMGLGGLQETAL